MNTVNFYLSKSTATGANLYNQSLIDFLQSEGIGVNKNTPYGKTTYGRTYFQMLKQNVFDKHQTCDISIVDQRYSAFMFSNYIHPDVIIFHHWDEKEHIKKSRKHHILKLNMIAQLRRARVVVVVSEYWKEKLIDEYQLENVRVIYNSFDHTDYKPNITKEEFLKKFGLSENPIVFLGKNSVIKTYETYKKLKVLKDEYQFVTSGYSKEFEGPIHLDLDFNDYINLLSFSKVSILLTSFQEGWNRVAHESILCNTPVIGMQGSGGMEELLLKSQLPMLTKDEISGIQFNFAKLISQLDQFSMDSAFAKSLSLRKFRSDWRSLIKELY